MHFPILPMPPDLWPAVREIYREGIATGDATFETELPDWEKWDGGHRKDCRLVAVEPPECSRPETSLRAEHCPRPGSIAEASANPACAGKAAACHRPRRSTQPFCRPATTLDCSHSPRKACTLQSEGRALAGCSHHAQAAAIPSAIWVANSPTSRKRIVPLLHPRPQRLAVHQLADGVFDSVVVADLI
jgi:hypothetical protein